jgi:2-oxo-3-hexenedioate decarboxylase
LPGGNLGDQGRPDEEVFRLQDRAGLRGLTPLTTVDIPAIAAEVKAARDAARQIEPFSKRYPQFDLTDAYDSAELVHRAQIAEGARPVGRKIGFTNRALWPKYDVWAPIWAYVYDRTVVRLKPGERASCRLGRFCELLIEPEVVLHFRSAPPQDGGLEGLLDAIDWVAHGFEIVQSHFPGWKVKAPDTVANCGMHARLFVGPPQPLEGLGDGALAALASFSLDLYRDGRRIDSGKGANALDSPLAATAHLVAVLAQQRRAPLAAGELVTTGTITGAHPVRPGETWRTEISGIALPGLEIAFSD